MDAVIETIIPARVFFRVHEVAAILSVPTPTVYSWTRSGLLPSRKVGAVVLVARPDLVTLLSMVA